MIMSALFLATTNKILIDAIFKPLKEKFPSHDFFWLFYVSLLTGGAIGWFSEGNMFAEFIPDAIFGRVLTSILIGGGASLIHELFGNLNTAIRSVSINNWSQAEAADVIANTPPIAGTLEQVENILTPADVSSIARMEATRVLREAAVQ